MGPVQVKKIGVVKHGKRYKRTVIPDGYERCKESKAQMVTWGYRNNWFEHGCALTPVVVIRERRPIYIKRKA